MSRQNPAARMQDPAGGVPQQLLPHMHLVSSYRYPSMANLTMETAVEYLLSAPKVVRELQPMHWMFLDAPPDGTVMLVWQPLNHLGTNFASDGYVWGDAEQVYTTESRGYTVEMWLHRCGYHPPHETVATHARRRFRLTPAKTPNPNLPPPDPSLWIVHYAKAPSIDQIPVTHIAVPPAIHNILAQRRFLQSQGQLARKEFMLHDRNTWPTISLPPQVGQQPYAQPSPYAQPYMARHPQAPFFQHPPGANMPPGQVKTPRGHRATASAAMAAAALPDFSLEDEEVSTGDFLDNITPREISRLRYRHNHEWMEEIFDSPYRINQILPVDLGLGRKGELESLTKGYLEAPAGPSPGAESDATVSKMEPERMEEFTNAVTKRVADVTAEIEALKRRHARRLEKINRLSVLKEGEVALRDAYVDPSNVGKEFWRIENRLRPIVVTDETMQQVEYNEPTSRTKVADISAEVQKAWGEPIVPLKEVICVDKGGLEEPVKESPQPTTEPSAADVDMGNGEDLSKDLELPTAQGESVSEFEAAKQGAQATQEVTGDVSNAAQGNIQAASGPSGDIEMGGVNEGQAPASADQLGEDWVVVNKDEKTSRDGSPKGDQAESIEQPSAPKGASMKEPEGTTPRNNTGLEAPEVLETSNFEDAASFSHIDSAGEALAAYEENSGLDLEGLDNSAFGDAFHASEGGHQHHDTEDIS
ncbi:uncharacterized protein CIMG_01119 [Coccidioides immitis RS]|uniref:DUF1750-domain-containing protein n=1 Tax=Coccidioides immitis (strain RS) TaxID=246410 RepID=J3KIG9_COCIM|nr:uncharacterized protein CIMG_01119 [Coccidioides immitis RS]EAS35765.3 hypothetical protein CIMG_01119 [Coccidioides immitis RS]